MYDILKDFAAPSATIIAAVAAAWITISIQRRVINIQRAQADVAIAKLKLDLYERRLEIMTAVRNFLLALHSNKAFDGFHFIEDEVWAEFKAKTSATIFLYGKDVQEYISSVEELGSRVEEIKLAVGASDGTDLDKDRAMLREARREVRDFLDQLVPTFTPYLKLSDVERK